MISLERRLHVGLALCLVLFMGIFWLVGNHVIRDLSEDTVAERLRLDAWSLESALVLGAESPPPRRRRIDPAYDQPHSGHYYLIRVDDGRGLDSPSLGDHELEIPRLAPGESRRMRTEGPEGEPLLLLLEGFQREGQGFTIAVAEDLTPNLAQQMLLMRKFAFIAGGGLLVMLLLQSLLVRRVLRVLERVRDDVHRLERGGAPQLSEEVPAELLPLVRDLNHMLSLVGRRLERSRNALGNLAQALRRPLALLIRYLNDEEEEEDLQRSRAGNQLESIQRLTRRGMRRAGGFSEPGVQRRPFDPRGDLGELGAFQQQHYQEYPLEIDFGVAEEMPPFGDREEILELLGNLLDHACERAATRVNGQLSGSDGVEIRVEDDGTVTPQGEEQPEAGLEAPGLAVVREIVQLYGGTLELGRSQELGGLQVRILLPEPGY